jgi:hypothetical protein
MKAPILGLQVVPISYLKMPRLEDRLRQLRWLESREETGTGAENQISETERRRHAEAPPCRGAAAWWRIESRGRRPGPDRRRPAGLVSEASAGPEQGLALADSQARSSLAPSRSCGFDAAMTPPCTVKGTVQV